MSTSAASPIPLAFDVSCTTDELVVRISDGRVLSVPLAWFPRLLDASPSQREHWELLGNGEGIHWPDVDEDVSVEGLLRGTRAPSRRVTPRGAKASGE
jgi:hypothetical protein